MRLEPSTGRSINVGTGIDFARGLRLLEQSCARNRVRADFTSQRFHERGGLKRKRLRRQRWRRRFMEGFKATVGRVKQLKNQGW
jgi:ribosomal protein S21